MNRKQNGRCCDSFCLPCEVYFKLCLDSESSDNNRCNLGKHTTRIIEQREKHRFVIRMQFPFTSFGVSTTLFSDYLVNFQPLLDNENI